MCQASLKKDLKYFMENSRTDAVYRQDRDFYFLWFSGRRMMASSLFSTFLAKTFFPSCWVTVEKIRQDHQDSTFVLVHFRDSTLWYYMVYCIQSWVYSLCTMYRNDVITHTKNEYNLWSRGAFDMWFWQISRFFSLSRKLRKIRN